MKNNKFLLNKNFNDMDQNKAKIKYYQKKLEKRKVDIIVEIC